MPGSYVVRINCTSVKEVTSTKQLLYCFEVTWSDESTTTKELSSDDFLLFRKRMKTDVYKSRPQIAIPEVPDGKVSGLFSKTKKAEKRMKHINEFCSDIINLPHEAGKLQAIAVLFGQREEDELRNQLLQRKGSNEPNCVQTDESQSNPAPITMTTAEENRLQSLQETKTNAKTESESNEPKVKEPHYAQVVRQPNAPKSRSRSTLNYVELEILHKDKREQRQAASSIYAEVVILNSQHSDWLLPTADESDGEQEQNPDREARTAPPPPSPTQPPPLGNIHPTHPSPACEVPYWDLALKTPEVPEKTSVEVPEPATEMSDSAESTPKKDTIWNGKTPKQDEYPIFDAAMMSNFPSGTLIPLQPSHSSKPCPSSSDLKLDKSMLPKEDDGHVYVVAVSGFKALGEANILSFKRRQRADLLYTSASWWFVSTGEALGWVPADAWRIVTGSKVVSGKPMQPYEPWSVGVLGRKESEDLLRKANHLDFFVRESANSTGHLVLSVQHDVNVRHFEIHLTDDGTFYIGCHHFNTLHNVIIYYKKKSLFEGYRLGKLFKPKK